MTEYIVSEPFTVEVTETNYALDVAMDRYVLTKVCEYGECLNLERIVRCRDCKYSNTVGHAVYCNYDPFRPLLVKPHGFCHHGKPKEE